MRPVLALTAAAGLLLATAGCFTREEKIVVRPDGSAVVTYEMTGTAPEWAGDPFVPGNLGWRLVDERTEMKGDGSETTRTWQAELRDLAAYPERFAAPDDPRAGLAPEFETRLDVRREPGRTVYSFTRVYRGRRAGKFDELREMADDGTRRAELEARAEEEGLDSLSERERDELFAGLAEYEAGAMWLRVRDALGAAVLEGMLPASEYTPVVTAVGEFLDQRLTGPYLRRFFAADEAAQDSELARLRAELRAEVESLLPAAGHDRILRLLELEEDRFRVTRDLGDDHFVLEVELPGVVVAGNALLAEDGKAAWDFAGEDLLEGDLVLTAVSVLEHGKAGR